MRHYTLLIYILLWAVLPVSAQITHTWHEESLSEVLRTIASESKDYHIHCIYDHLDSLRVSATVVGLTPPAAVARVTKGQPVKVKQKRQDIFVQYDARQARRKLQIRGSVLDRTSHAQLVGATVVLMRRDSTVVSRRVASLFHMEGNHSWNTADYSFEVPKAPDQYILAVSHVGYQTTYLDYSLSNIRKNEVIHELPPIYMKQESHVLQEVTVTASKVMFYYRGDTLVYNADAFQLAEGSMLDALVRQLPGVELRKNGQIYHNGRFVQSLLLNGKDFFRGNKELMLDNLPSYTVKEIKVYDRYGDRSQFLGRQLENDKAYVMDVQLKREYSIGWLANAEAGAGTDNRYLARLFALRFTDHSRLALYGNVNNLNDDRKPGETDDWEPKDMPTGRQAQRQAGIDFNTEDRDGRWKTDGNVQFTSTDLDQTETTRQTNFLQTGDTYDRIQNSQRDKTWALSADERLYTKFKQFDLTLNPVAKYQHYNLLSDYASATYAQTDTLINRQLLQGKTRGHDLSLSLEARSTVKLGGENHIDLLAKAGLADKDDDRFLRQHIQYAARPSLFSDRLHRNHPDRTGTYRTEATFVHYFTTQFAGNLEYDYEHRHRRRDNALHQLDLADSLGTEPFGITPTEADFARTFDAQNSYSYQSHDNLHSLQPYFNWFPRIGGNKASIGLFAQVSHLDQHMHYQRGALDTTLVRRTTYFESPNNYFHWGTKDRKYTLFAQYTLKVKAPELTNLVDICDATDPMNVYTGSTDLKNEATHKAVMALRYRDRRKRYFYKSLNFVWDYYQNQLTQGYLYNPETGVRTWRPYSVNGNWHGYASSENMMMLDKGKHFELLSRTELRYDNRVSMVGTSTAPTATPQRYSIHNASAYQRLRLKYEWGENHLTLNAEGTCRHVSSPQPAFDSFSPYDINYGVSGFIRLPLKMQLSTDLTAYTRRGYTASEMNGTDLVWNARLTCPLMKGRLLLALDGFDLLGQLSNVTRTVNAQSRTETWTNSLPRYALLHAIWRLDKKPKKQGGKPD